MSDAERERRADERERARATEDERRHREVLKALTAERALPK